MTAEVAITYTLSVNTSNYFLTSLFSSYYFAGISIMLIFFMVYIIDYVELKSNRVEIIFYIILQIWGLADVTIQLLNPFFEISMHYVYNSGSVVMWQYKPKTLYYGHLAYSYLIIVAILMLLLYRSFRTPKAYRTKYLGILGGIFFTVVLNGIFLFIHNGDMLDYSVLFYCVIVIFLYWNRYYYSSHGMLNGVRQLILNELDQPVILFDNKDELAMYNKLAAQFVSNEDFKIKNLKEFIEKWDFPITQKNMVEETHFQWNYHHNECHTIYRVDFKFFKDHKSRNIGKLVVMTDTSLEMDLLTGFHSKNSYESYFRNISGGSGIEYPVGVVVLDLNKLSQINKKYGEEKGDEAIQKLSRLMEKCFPANTYFARLEDANLLAIRTKTDREEIRKYIYRVREELEMVKDFEEPLEIQSAVAIATEQKPSIIEAVDTALFSMRSKKLMDGNSAHSSLLDSLAQTLLESDDTTRAHVERTKNIGEMLGKRLSFTDVQQSKLALLCLLHDIGKLGIPLEILNKPGKLNSAEWDVMKSHVEKGYRIAMASKELEEIADLILHHHESWNGKGYPDGLKQESIPLLSRIIAVVDTYDAMTNDRPYHKAVSDREAREELKRCAGVQFDPSIVSEFLAMLEEIKPLEPVEQKTQVVKETDKNAPRGVKEIFSQITESANVQPLVYANYILNNQGEIIQIDENFENLTGYGQNDLAIYHLTQFDLLPLEDRDSYMKTVSSLLDKEKMAYIEHRILRKDGSKRDVFCLGKMFFDSVTREPKSEVIVFDISTSKAFSLLQKMERESAQRSLDKWETLLRKDSLTGLLNHESFINDVEMELIKNDQQNVLLILDVDYFKVFNDTYGHLEGDKLLSLVSILLESSVKDIGFAGRLGGDEFAALLCLPKGISLESVEKEVAKVFNLIMNTINSQEHYATISLGAACAEESETFNHLYMAADRALYRAKDKGRMCYSL